MRIISHAALGTCPGQRTKPVPLSELRLAPGNYGWWQGGGQVCQVPGLERGDDTLVPPDDRPRDLLIPSLPSSLLPCAIRQSFSSSSAQGHIGRQASSVDWNLLHV